MSRICLISDESAQSLSEATLIAQGLGAREMSLRLSSQQRFPHFAKEDIEILLHSPGANKITFIAATPGLWKDSLESYTAACHRKSREGLEETIQLAKRASLERILFFSGLRKSSGDTRDFRRPATGMPGLVLETLQDAGRAVRAAGMTPLLENGYQVWGDTGLASNWLIEQMPDAGFRLAWDPCNSLAARSIFEREEERRRHFGRDILLELEEIHPHIADIHVRDIELLPDGWNWVPIGEGIVPWAAIVAFLKEKGYTGTFTVEHHLFDQRRAATEHTFRFLEDLLRCNQ